MALVGLFAVALQMFSVDGSCIPTGYGNEFQISSSWCELNCFDGAGSLSPACTVSNDDPMSISTLCVCRIDQLPSEPPPVSPVEFFGSLSLTSTRLTAEFFNENAELRRRLQMDLSSAAGIDFDKAVIFGAVSLHNRNRRRRNLASESKFIVPYKLDFETEGSAADYSLLQSPSSLSLSNFEEYARDLGFDVSLLATPQADEVENNEGQSGTSREPSGQFLWDSLASLSMTTIVGIVAGFTIFCVAAGAIVRAVRRKLRKKGGSGPQAQPGQETIVCAQLVDFRETRVHQRTDLEPTTPEISPRNSMQWVGSFGSVQASFEIATIAKEGDEGNCGELDSPRRETAVI